MPTIKDFGEGSTVLLNYSPTMKQVVSSKSKDSILIPARILEKVGSYVTVGWSKDQTIPNTVSFAKTFVKPGWASAYGIVEAHNYGSHVECLDQDASTKNQPTNMVIRSERPCKNSTCGRMNDVGVHSCWWCGMENPTG